LSSQKLKENYGEDLHPKVLDLALRILNERYASSNSRCIATLQAMKHYIYDFELPANKALSRELEGHINRIRNFL
jgi:translation initiation factor 2B subunit (eIF-2B alpha/beta/delta family)